MPDYCFAQVCGRERVAGSRLRIVPENLASLIALQKIGCCPVLLSAHSTQAELRARQQQLALSAIIDDETLDQVKPLARLRRRSPNSPPRLLSTR